jgi:nicotinic acid mononucleotide adenylyltransferase
MLVGGCMKLSKDKFVYYGSFNPMTLGHRSVIGLLIKKFGDGIEIIVEPVNEKFYPPKENVLVSIKHRQSMILDTCFEIPNVVLGLQTEFDDHHTKWCELAQHYNAKNIVLGNDNLPTLEKYFSTKGEYIEDMLGDCNMIVVTRDDSDGKEYVKNSKKLSEYKSKFTFLNNDVNFSSSTQVREKIKNKKNFSSDVHTEVFKYINRYKLYQGE